MRAPIRSVEVQAAELEALDDAAGRELVQCGLLGFNVGAMVVLVGIGLVRGELVELLPALGLGALGFAGSLSSLRAARSYRLAMLLRWRGRGMP